MLSSRQYRAAIAVFVAAIAIAGVTAGALATTPTETGIEADVAAQETTTVANETGAVSVQNLSAPSEVRLGQGFTVSSDLVNTVNRSLTRRVSYRIEGNVIASTLVRLPAGATERVVFNITGEDTSGFPAETLTHGVFTTGANATANLTLLPAGETTTTPEAETTTQVTETTQTTTEPATTTTAAQTAAVTFEEQASTGETVTVESVTVPEGGFIVLHNTSILEGNVVDSTVGQSGYLAPGLSENVTVDLDEPLNESQRLVAVVYRDSNENQQFDFLRSNRTADGPYTVVGGQEAINEIAVVEVQQETTNQTTASSA